ncbi:MAG: SGNH/GDSL hydrolase family protein [Kiritimatiellae bacterium]|nr:SGNH/GDSL hydrolase family protein [Kiritimatiellia bacterium]
MRFLRQEFNLQNTVFGESLVFAGTNPERLLQARIIPGSVALRSKYLDFDQGVIIYEEGKDYAVDHENGALCRTPGSRIPDYRDHVFYGRERFDHREAADFGNARFTVYCDYAFAADEPPMLSSEPGNRLFPDCFEKKQMTIGIIGDSITYGCDATVSERSYAWQWADALERKYHGVSFRVYNKAVGGMASERGVTAFERELAPLKPDIVLIGFGMNDQNRGASGDIATPPGKFMANLNAICASAKKANPDALIALVSPMLPNPRWRHTSGRLLELRAVLRGIADNNGYSFADVTSCWERMLARKSVESLAANNVNHPNDFGHWIYAQLVKAATIEQEDK